MKPWPGEEAEGTASGTMVMGDGQGALEARAGEKSRHAKPQKAPFMAEYYVSFSLSGPGDSSKRVRAPKLARAIAFISSECSEWDRMYKGQAPARARG